MYGPSIVKQSRLRGKLEIDMTATMPDCEPREVVFVVLDNKGQVCWKSKCMNGTDEKKAQFDIMRRKFGPNTLKNKAIPDESYPGRPLLI